MHHATQPVPNHHAARSPMPDQSGHPSAHPALSRLVGRERELSVLHDALDAATMGHGSLVLIGGEAGIGKTTLAETLLAEGAERGALSVAGHCYGLSETPPFG